MSRLSKNIIYNFLGQGILLILGFVAVKYVFRQLGEDALGIIYFALTMNSVLVAVLDLGIFSTTVREVSAHSGDEPVYVQELIRTASFLTWTAYVLVAVGIYFGAPILVQKWINLKTMHFDMATHVLRVLGIAVLIALPRSLYSSLFRGLQRMEFNNIIDVGIIGILAFGGGLLPVVYWIAASYGMGVFSYALCTRRFFPSRALFPGFSTSVVRRNLRYSSNMMSVSLLAMVHTQSDKVIVSKLLPIGALGYYGFAYAAVSKATLLTSAIAQAAFPSFSSLFGSARRHDMMIQYRKLQDLVCFGTVPLFAVIPFTAFPVLNFVFNSEISRMLFIPVMFLTLGIYMNGTLNVPYVFSLAVGKPDIAVRLNFYALFVVLPATVVFIYLFGLVGAGLSCVFYHLFAYAYGVRRICFECMEIPVWQWYKHVLRIFVLTGATYGVAWLILGSFSAHSILNGAFAYSGASILFLVGAYLMIGDELRETLLVYLQRLQIAIASITSRWKKPYPVSGRDWE
jgi:O-antigen/teichoic acid export membrane protein